MFNLTVDEAQTFYVVADGWLVHNQNKPALPTATALRAWAIKQSYIKTKNGTGMEIWVDSGNDWRLKIKPPSQHADIHVESKEFRYAARTPTGQYIDPIIGSIGPKKIHSHFPLTRAAFKVIYESILWFQI